MRSVTSRLLCLVAILLLGACASDFDDGGADAGPASDAGIFDPTDELFRPDHILEVDITMAAADWAALRIESGVGVPKVTCNAQPTERAYTYFSADITIDGQATTNVGLRKKGGFGSINSARPGLKVKASEYVKSQRLFGLKRLTLNNNSQDPTYISQCLGYGLFTAAGLPASRCSFAHVTVNGENLGIYSNVESIKKPMIRRHFTDDSGRIYESGGEFATGSTGGFQPKTNKDAPDCSDLPPIATALDGSPSQRLASLDPLVDIDAFMTYWATEVMLNHWDGYANNRNNYFFYHDPTSDKMHMIPWGIDALFTGRSRTTRPDSVYACGRMTWRLYDAPDARPLYLAKLRELLTTVWDEAAIVAEIDRMEALITPIADPGGTGQLATQIDRVRTFVNARRATLMAELNQGDPVWPYAENESCLPVIGSVSGSFDTTWDTLDDFGAGTGSMSGDVAGTDVTSSTVFTSSGPTAEGQAVIQVVAQLPSDDFAVVTLIVQDITRLEPSTLPIDLVTVASFMSFYDPDTDTAYGGGLILGGTLTLTSASTAPDAPIVGSFSGDVREL